MRKSVIVTGLIVLGAVFQLSSAQDTDKVELTLEDCIVKALEKNLDIKVQAYNPEINDVAVSQAKEAFLPKMNFYYLNESQNNVGSWWLEGTNYSTDYNQYYLNLRQRILTGTEFSLLYYNTTTDTTRNFTSINPTYNNQLRLNINQPLLKDFGPLVNRYEIKRAQNQRDISVLDLNRTITEKVFEVERVYWNLVNAIENLRVRQLALAQVQQQLENTREAARVGTKSAIDVLYAETEVVNNEGLVLSARAQLETFEDQLKALLNLPPDGLESFKAIIPLDKPTLEKPTVSFEEALEISLERNPQIMRIKKELENSSLVIRYHRNQLLPQLNLNFSLWYYGQGGVRNLYQDNNPFTGVIVDQVESTRWDAFKDILDRKYQNWRVEVQFNIPLENFFSRAGLAQAKLEEEKMLLEKDKEEKAVYYEILEIYKTLRNREKTMESTTRSREMMEKKVEVEEQRYRLGLVQSSEWLFQYQRQLAEAKAREIKAVIDYKIAVAQLEKAMGISLDKKNLAFEGY
ncbi:MAG: TolC family protein [Candidatus Aminicenantes bacterium]|jgi:outer membrane protein TolC